MCIDQLNAALQTLGPSYFVRALENHYPFLQSTLAFQFSWHSETNTLCENDRMTKFARNK